MAKADKNGIKTATGRDEKGRFTPNNKCAKGRPGKSVKQKIFEEQCRKWSLDALDTLIEVMRDTKAIAPRIKAATTILEYAYGKPKQVQIIQGDNEDGGITLTAVLDPRCKDGK